MFKSIILFIPHCLKQYFSRSVLYLTNDIFILAILTSLYVIFNRFELNGLVFISFFWILLIMYYNFEVLILQRKMRKKYDICGLKRWDKTFEIHIADTIKTPVEFQRKLINIILFARSQDLKIEFISSYRSYGRLMRDFGNAILLIKPLNFWNQLLMGALIKPYLKKGMSADHLHQVVLDPQKIKLKQLKNGTYMIQPQRL